MCPATSFAWVPGFSSATTALTKWIFSLSRDGLPRCAGSQKGGHSAKGCIDRGQPLPIVSEGIVVKLELDGLRVGERQMAKRVARRGDHVLRQANDTIVLQPEMNGLAQRVAGLL